MRIGIVRWSVVGVIAVGFGMGCASSEGETGGTLITDVAGSTGGCKRDADCPSGAICQNGQCVGGSSSDAAAPGDSGTLKTDAPPAPSDTPATPELPVAKEDGTSPQPDTAKPPADTGGGTPACTKNEDCPNGGTCCSVGNVGSYCAANAAACYGKECKTAKDCADGQECCDGFGVLPSFCGPKGGCYGPQCQQSGDCGAGRECCPTQLGGICGPANQCIGNTCKTAADCDPGVGCCALAVQGQAIQICLIDGICAVANGKPVGGGPPGKNTTCKDQCGTYFGPDGGCQCDPPCVKNGNCCKDYEALCVAQPGKNTTCKDQCGKYFGPDGGCHCDPPCVKNGNCCKDFEQFCGTDPNPGTGCKASSECQNGQICCKGKDGAANACTYLCDGCKTGADCVDNGCCVTQIGTACTPKNFCVLGTWDPK